MEADQSIRTVSSVRLFPPGSKSLYSKQLSQHTTPSGPRGGVKLVLLTIPLKAQQLLGDTHYQLLEAFSSSIYFTNKSTPPASSNASLRDDLRAREIAEIFTIHPLRFDSKFNLRSTPFPGASLDITTGSSLGIPSLSYLHILTFTTYIPTSQHMAPKDHERTSRNEASLFDTFQAINSLE